MATVRRPKWHPPPPPPPFRRTLHRPPKGQLQTLFGQETTFCYTILPASPDEAEIQSQILKAECKFIRLQRDISAKRSQRERDSTLKSALHALISAKRKIVQGQNAEFVLEDEIQDLKKKLMEIRKSSKKVTRRDPQLLKETRQLQKQECVPDESCNRFADVEVLRRKMERLSNGKLFRKMEEEYGVMVSSVQEPFIDRKVPEQNMCVGDCKVLVRRIMEQVRAETEQWTQMQEMLGQVREEMEELQASRHFWEEQAVDSDYKINSLNKTVQEWEQKAESFEVKEKQLEDLVKSLQDELKRANMEKASARTSKESAHKSWGAHKPHEEENKALKCRVKGIGLVDENCMTTKENLHEGKKATRMPFMEIGNLSPLVRQTSRRSVFPLQSHQC